MQQGGVVACAEEFEDVGRGADVRRQRVAQVGIEIRQAGAVDDQIERAPSRRRTSGDRPRSGWLTSPSTTSTRWRRKSGEPAPVQR